MINKTSGTFAVFVLGLVLVSVANASLVSRLSGQAIYDTDLNITWLADANLAKTNNFGLASGILANGNMDWSTAGQWIGAMNTANYLGFNDWRLPTTAQPDFTCDTQSGGFGLGFNCAGSEFGHLFYIELAGTAGTTGPGTATIGNIPNFQLFTNIERLSFPSSYWSGTTFNTSNTWIFDFGNAEQRLSSKNSNLYAWAVRTGDVAPIPVPATVWLLGSGLLSLFGIAQRRVKPEKDK